MNPKADFDILLLLRILEASEKIKLYSFQFIDAIEFFEANDQKEFNACLNLLAQIGEHAKKISDTSRKIGKDIQWEQLIGLRNRLVHDYTGIDKFITFEIIRNSIPDTISKISTLINLGMKSGFYQAADIQLAKTSPYLRNVDFSLLMSD